MQAQRGIGIDHDRIARFKTQHLLKQLGVLTLSTEGENGKAIRMTGDHVERALTDGAGRPQDGDALDGVLGHGLG